jgi:hypothetical protein
MLPSTTLPSTMLPSTTLRQSFRPPSWFVARLGLLVGIAYDSMFVLLGAANRQQAVHQKDEAKEWWGLPNGFRGGSFSATRYALSHPGIDDNML